MLLEAEGRDPVEDPSWSDIAQSLRDVTPAGVGFVILTVSDGRFMQTAGGPAGYILEVRTHVADSFRHYVLGRVDKGCDGVTLATSMGPLALFRNEILDIDDVLRGFRHFFATGEIEPSFACRDNTQMFKND